MGKTSSKSKHQGKKTTNSRGDRRARRRAQRAMNQSITDGTELNERDNMSTRTTDTQKLRMLINRVDGIMQKINLATYETQADIRADLRNALLKTGAWVH